MFAEWHFIVVFKNDKMTLICTKVIAMHDGKIISIFAKNVTRLLMGYSFP
jgi:hypothetical protein